MIELGRKRPAFSENIHRLFDEAQATNLAPGIVSLIESRATHAQIREVPTNRILPNPAQPRLSYEEESLLELADIDPRARRPAADPGAPGRQPVRADRRRATLARVRAWRSATRSRPSSSSSTTRPRSRSAIIENLQREDVSPLEEAAMFRKMTDLGYSACASSPRRSARTRATSRTASGSPRRRPRFASSCLCARTRCRHAYELMKVGDERTRRRLAKKVAAGELTLAQAARHHRRHR